VEVLRGVFSKEVRGEIWMKVYLENLHIANKEYDWGVNPQYKTCDVVQGQIFQSLAEFVNYLKTLEPEDMQATIHIHSVRITREYI